MYDEAMLALLTAPPTNDRTPRYMERALAAIHQAQLHRQPVTLIYASTGGRLGLFVQCARHIEQFVTDPIIANYPNCAFTNGVAIDAPPSHWHTWTTQLKLVPELFPILRHTQFEDLLNGTFADPASGILRAVAPEEGSLTTVAIHIVPAEARRQRYAQDALRLLERDFFRRHYRIGEYYAEHITRFRGWLIAWLFSILARQSPQPNRTTLETSGSRLHDREDDLQAASAKLGGHLFETHITVTVHVPEGQKRRAINRMQQVAGAFGAFTQSRLARFHLGRIHFGPQTRLPIRGSLLSHEELATLFHPPTATVEAAQMQTLEFRELEPPAAFRSGAEPGCVTLGRALFRGDDRLVGMDVEARRRHLYVIGSTGTGKSTFLLNLIEMDMRAARGMTLIDVHGDLAIAATERVPRHRTNEAIIFDAASADVIPFNPLTCTDPSRIDQVTSGVVSAFKKLYDSWGPRLENLLRYATFVAVEQHGTLLDMLRLLTDKAYRAQVIPRVGDEVVRSFWQHEFATWNVAYRTEAVSSVTNKLMPFLTARQLRAITTSSGRTGLDFRRIMDVEQILIVNLSRGRLGQDNATLLGSLLLTAIEQAALTRADIPEEERRDHFLFLDEFQSLTTPSTAIMLSESRKFRLSLTLSHQLTHQLDPATYHSVIGNVGTLLAFRVGLEDANLLAPALSKHPGQLSPADLCNLPNYTAYVRLLVDGHPSKPFSLRTLPPDVSDAERAAVVRRTSERRYARPVAALKAETLAPLSHAHR